VSAVAQQDDIKITAEQRPQTMPCVVRGFKPRRPRRIAFVKFHLDKGFFFDYIAL